MTKPRTYFSLTAVFILTVAAFGLIFPGYFNRGIARFNNLQIIKLPSWPVIPFKFGLDLQGGSHLLYEADFSGIGEKEKTESMEGLRDVIERRVNLFGVAESAVQIEEQAGRHRLAVELPGVEDIREAIEEIGKTPFLEFREERAEAETAAILEKQEKGEELLTNPYFKPTDLTGRYLKKGELGFDQAALEPRVFLSFDDEGAKIFEELTSKNIGKRLAIYIDNELISSPMVQEKISGGKAQITGDFTTQQAKELVRNLNAGALPVPINLISQNTVGPSLGKISLEKSLKAVAVGFLAICLFMLVIYRLSGFFAVLSLVVYSLVLLSIFKLLPVTITLAGVGGAILSVGMAVDANVLIFERQKEEGRAGESFSRALEIGFSRAWPSIRDSNFTTLLIALAMFYFGTSFIKGFALTLSLGILTSLFSALFVTKLFLRAFVGTKLEKLPWLWR